MYNWTVELETLIGTVATPISIGAICFSNVQVHSDYSSYSIIELKNLKQNKDQFSLFKNFIIYLYQENHAYSEIMHHCPDEQEIFRGFLKLLP